MNCDLEADASANIAIMDPIKFSRELALMAADELFTCNGKTGMATPSDVIPGAANIATSLPPDLELDDVDEASCDSSDVLPKLLEVDVIILGAAGLSNDDNDNDVILFPDVISIPDAMPIPDVMSFADVMPNLVVNKVPDVASDSGIISITAFILFKPESDCGSMIISVTSGKTPLFPSAFTDVIFVVGTFG